MAFLWQLVLLKVVFPAQELTVVFLQSMSKPAECEEVVTHDAMTFTHTQFSWFLTESPAGHLSLWLYCTFSFLLSLSVVCILQPRPITACLYQSVLLEWSSQQLKHTPILTVRYVLRPTVCKMFACLLLRRLEGAGGWYDWRGDDCKSIKTWLFWFCAVMNT